MMRTLSALAIAVALSAGTANAQVTTNITVGGQTVYTNNNGGAWSATSSVGLGSASLTSLTVYCFDNLRFFTPGAPTAYIALTFSEFVGNAGAGAGGRGSNWNTVTLADLNAMAGIAATYEAGLNASYYAPNTTRQNNIWSIANNAVQGDPSGPSFATSWMVLVDKAEWERGLNGQNGQIRGSQSFLIQVPSASTTVPEPSTYALMGAGLLAVGFMSRRRKSA